MGHYICLLITDFCSQLLITDEGVKTICPDQNASDCSSLCCTYDFCRVEITLLLRLLERYGIR